MDSVLEQIDDEFKVVVVNSEAPTAHWRFSRLMQKGVDKANYQNVLEEKSWQTAFEK